MQSQCIDFERFKPFFECLTNWETGEIGSSWAEEHSRSALVLVTNLVNSNQQGPDCMANLGPGESAEISAWLPE